MTVLMEKAIQETTALSESEQDFLATLLLDNIRDTKQWDAQFAASQDVLEELFDEATEDYRSGRTSPINASLCAPVSPRRSESAAAPSPPTRGVMP